MVLATLSVQKTGMITLPKKWRDRNPGTTVIAKETPEGLLIKPLSDVEYWEDDKGNFGLHFPFGMPLKDFAMKMNVAIRKANQNDARRKKHTTKVSR